MVDGSGLEIFSNGKILCNRQQICGNYFLEQPHFENKKFQGVNIQNFENTFQKLHDLKTTFEIWLSKESIECEFHVSLLGELLSFVKVPNFLSKSEQTVFKTYNYSFENEVKLGDFLTFNVNLYFEKKSLIDNPILIENIEKVFTKRNFLLKNLNFRKRSTPKNGEINLLLNDHLHNLLQLHQIPNIPSLGVFHINEAIAKFTPDILNNKVEGYVFTIPTKNGCQIYKLKGQFDAR